MRSRVLLGALLTLLVAALLLPAVAAAAHKHADTVFKNGYVYTVNPGARVAHAVAVKDGRIVYVGSNAGANAFVGPSTQVVKLGGKMMLPGFIDSHAHAGMTASALYSALLYGLTSVDEYVAAVKTFADANTDLTWVRGQGWSNTIVPDQGPLATDLDKAVPDRPAAIMSEDGHSYWVNTTALEAAGITGLTPDPVNGVIERVAGTVSPGSPYGTPSGTLRETAADLVTGIIPDYTVGQYENGIAYYQNDVAAPVGITTVFDPLLKVGSNAIQAYQDMADAGTLAVRVRGALSLDARDGLLHVASRRQGGARQAHEPACSRRRPSRCSRTASSRATPRTWTSPTPTRSPTRATRASAASRSGGRRS